MKRVLRFLFPLVVCALFIDQSIGESQRVRLIRGPYLQKGTDNQISIHWRTDIPTDTRVNYSTTVTNLHLSESRSTQTTDHSAKLKGLKARTKYYYAIGSQAETLATGSRYYFYTSPERGDSGSTRIWVIGDSGTANSNARRVRNSYSKFKGRRNTDLWLMLGDNAYESGSDSDYQAAVFRTFRKLLRTTVLWPTLGNHDVVLDNTPPRNIAYTQVFNLPKKGEAGGVPSRTEDYYSFDYGAIHFICLDSTTKDRSPDGPMLKWLKRDLKANNSEWVIAYWHHSPYSKGSHDSDEDTAMRQMRENVLPILEKYGVDLVLGGHNHSYQRSYLLHGHYDSSSTFRSSMIQDQGSGREEETGAYVKASGKRVPGTVYTVVGSSGKLDDIVSKHPAMFVALRQFGSLVIDVEENRIDAKFLQDTGVIGDHFTMIKQ